MVEKGKSIKRWRYDLLSVGGVIETVGNHSIWMWWCNGQKVERFIEHG